jgi:hypothetical protein
MRRILVDHARVMMGPVSGLVALIAKQTIGIETGCRSYGVAWLG